MDSETSVSSVRKMELGDPRFVKGGRIQDNLKSRCYPILFQGCILSPVSRGISLDIHPVRYSPTVNDAVTEGNGLRAGPLHVHADIALR